MNSFYNFPASAAIRNLKGFLSLFVILAAFIPPSAAQEFQFTPDVDHEIFYAHQNTGYVYQDPIYPSGVVYNRWTQMQGDASWPDKYQFKSIANVIRVGVNHDIKTIHNNYKYKFLLNIKGYTDPLNLSAFTNINNLVLTLEYNKDSLVSYKDEDALKLKDAAFFKMEVSLVQIYDISNPSSPTTVSYGDAEKNFYIESSIITQRYDKQAYNLFINSQLDQANHELAVNWSFYDPNAITPNCNSTLPGLEYKPVKYELEWTYVDDYKATGFNGTSFSYGYKNTGTSFSIPYNFKNNATRIQTYDRAYRIPVIYEHGSIVFRIRTIRPDPSNYGKLIYSPWNITDDIGTIDQNTFVNNLSTTGPYQCKSQCVCLIPAALENDKFDWQYSVNFAEEGKYKHVLNYFDGAGHNRQTQTKINTDTGYVIAADHIYDFEGRPSIQTLPTPVQSHNLDYKSSLSWKAGTTSPYQAGDFDKGCLADSIYGFDGASYAGLYYSAANPHKEGMQQFVPDAEGYPFIETIYSPDNTNKVLWQGGAGKTFQRFLQHGTTNTYVRANQEELNRLFGTQAGRYEYYPKVITRDPNGQISFSIFNQGGKVVATALAGSSPNSDSIPITALDSLPAATAVTSNILANLTQATGDGLRSANYSFFPEAGGDNSWKYKGAIAPYATGCGSWYLNAQGFYKIKVVDECGNIKRSEGVTAVGTSSIATTNAKQYFSLPTSNPFTLIPAKYTLIKELYFPDTTLVRLADTFVRANSGIGKCYDYEDAFIRRSVDSAKFPCKKDSMLSHCDELKLKMMAELYPGAKYGHYTGTLGPDAGTFQSGDSNSIFTLVDEYGQLSSGGGSTSCSYTKHCSYENGGGPVTENGFELYSVDEVVACASGFTPSPAPGVVYTAPGGPGSTGNLTCTNSEVTCVTYKCRYQWDCVALPHLNYTIPGSNPSLMFVGTGNQAPPDILMATFNDQIAEKLLPYHPEYCKLLLCDDHLEEILQKITDYKDAKALGLNTLQKILNQDVLCHNATTNPYGPLQPDTLSHLSIAGALQNSSVANNYLLQRLDSLAFEMAYCGSDGPEAYAFCRMSQYHTEIQAMNVEAADTQVQNSFIRNLIAMYIGNRNLIRQRLMDQTSGDCTPCPEMRMQLELPPVFAPVFDGNYISGGLPLPADVQAAFNDALAGSANGLPDTISNIMEAQQNNLAQAQAIVDALLPNCVLVHPSDMDHLYNFIKDPSVCGENGEKLTPEIVRGEMESLGIPIDNLCNPLLAQYGIFDPEQAKPAQKFANKDASFYSGFTAFLNRGDVKNAISAATPSGGTASSFTLLTANRFESDLSATLNGSTSVSVRGYKVSISDPGYLPGVGTLGTTRNYVKLVVDNGSGYTETIYLTKRMQVPCNNNASYDIPVVAVSAGSFSFSDAHSVLDDAASGLADGLIADNVVFVRLDGTNGSTPVCDNYIAWTAKTPMMDRKGSESMDDCINCVQIKQAVDGYFADAAAFGLPLYANHPNFKVDLTNYLNFQLGKKHGYYDYERLMKGCALSDRVTFRNAPGQYHLVYVSGQTADANYFISNINQALAAANTTGQGNAAINAFTYKEGSDIHIWVDLNSVRDTFYRLVENMVLNNPNYVGTTTDDDLIMEFLVPVTGCDVTGLLSLLSSNSLVAVSNPAVTVRLKDLSGEYNQQYIRFALTGANSMDPLQAADVIALVRGYFSDPVNGCPDVMFLDGRKVMRDSSYYTNSDKQLYLDYAFNLADAGQSLYDISNNIAPDVLQGATGSGVAPFAGADLVSYKNPWCDNIKRDLYYGPNPTLAIPGWDTLIKIINCVKANSPAGLGTGKLFLSETDNIRTIASMILGSSSSLKAIKMSNGWSWYRLFSNQNRRYNVYLIPPPNMLDTFSFYSVAPGAVPMPVAGGDNLYRFKILMVRQTVGMTDPHYVTCYGFTDFPLGQGKVLKDVVLSDGIDKPSCLDTFPCERSTMLTAILQGKAMYANYMDSIKGYHYARMKNWFPENTVDSLDFSTWKQQYQYTLYNYDLAGNLANTVPPEGVKPMTDISNIDNYRNTNFSGAGSYPPFLNLGNTSGGKKSEYYYNSLNQLIKQSTPDGGITTFYYDNGGRLVFSQNAKQAPLSKYSYTLYDDQGRICETGATTFPGSTNAIVTNSGTSSMAAIASAVRGRPREDVVATFYDEALLPLNTYTNEGLDAQENLRKRVSSILYIPQLAVANSAESWYSYATHFSYDALGNVKTLVQDNPYMNYLGQRFKRIDYDYDLLSGKVNMVSYNRGKADQFYQKYAYDADNRITDVQTSNDALIWDRDAHYDYYKHGPLAQIEIGDLKVQSLQYAYTIQGWLKAINGDVLDSVADMGQDGKNGGLYPKDAVAHALDYFPGDYKPIGTRQVESADNSGTFYRGLYNGNIARQTTGIHSLDNLQRTYTYDQLNRIRQTVYNNVNNLTHAVTAMANANAFANSYQYDKDGNIKKLTRRDGSGTLIDSFTYNYFNTTVNNKLTSVSDNAAATGGSDLQNQPANNYTYDQIGNLKTDGQGNIQGITWNMYGKATDLSMNTNNKLIHFDYDGAGNRIRKDVTVLETSGGVTNGMRNSDLYVRDASGNILAVYKGRTKISGGLTIAWANDHINSYHGSWHTPSGYGLSPFLAAEFGNNGQFTAPLLDIAQSTDISWCDEESNVLSLSQYLMASEGILSQAVRSDVSSYFGPLRDYDDGQTISGPFQYDITKYFSPLYDNLISAGDDPDSAAVDEGVALLAIAKMLEQAPNITKDMGTILKIDMTGKDDEVAQNFYAYTDKYGISDFLQSFADRVRAYPDEAGKFVQETVRDSAIISSAWLGRHLAAQDNISEALMNAQDKTPMASFFEGWLPQQDAGWLANHTSLNERLNIVMQSDMTTFMDNYLATIGIGAVNTSLQSIAQMSVGNYVQAIWDGVLHGSLNPSYTPPNVNTPDSSNIANDTIYLAEHHLYGSSRLGIKTYDPAAYRVVYKGATGPGTQNIILENTLGILTPWYDGGFADWIKKDKSTAYTGNTFNLATDSFSEVRTLGAKQYELTDHLGNVLATALDKKTGYGDSIASGLHYNKGYWANLSNVTDYYPGGFEMPSRIKQSPLSLGYRFGNQKQEEDYEIYGEGNVSAFKHRFEDTRLNRFFTIDPLSAKYPANSSYAFSENRLTDGIELEGKEFVHMTKYEYTGSWTDYLKTIPNAITTVFQGAFDMTWNSGVANVQAIQRGTWTKDITNELKSIPGGVKQYAVNSYNYTVNTPFTQQLKDAASPQSVETMLSFTGSVALGKLPEMNFSNMKFGLKGWTSTAAEESVANTSLVKYNPPNGGALGEWKPEFLMPGDIIDRYGSEWGRYFSPAGTPMEMRALPAGNTGAYNVFQVVKPFEVQSSTIAPAFGKIGLGKQYLAPVNMKTLLKKGFIKTF